MTKEIGIFTEGSKHKVEFVIERPKKDIGQVQTSCGCTSYKLVQDFGATHLIVTYKAGKVPHYLKQVEVEKEITVFFNDKTRENYYIKGTLKRKWND